MATSGSARLASRTIKESNTFLQESDETTLWGGPQRDGDLFVVSSDELKKHLGLSELTRLQEVYKTKKAAVALADIALEKHGVVLPTTLDVIVPASQTLSSARGIPYAGAGFTPQYALSAYGVDPNRTNYPKVTDEYSRNHSVSGSMPSSDQRRGVAPKPLSFLSSLQSAEYAELRERYESTLSGKNTKREMDGTKGMNNQRKEGMSSTTSLKGVNNGSSSKSRNGKAATNHRSAPSSTSSSTSSLADIQLEVQVIAETLGVIVRTGGATTPSSQDNRDTMNSNRGGPSSRYDKLSPYTSYSSSLSSRQDRSDHLSSTSSLQLVLPRLGGSTPFHPFPSLSSPLSPTASLASPLSPRSTSSPMGNTMTLSSRTVALNLSAVAAAAPKMRLTDNDGIALTCTEFVEALGAVLYLSHVRTTVKALKVLFMQLDADANGSLDWDEVTAFIVSVSKPTNEGSVHVLKRLGNGTIGGVGGGGGKSGDTDLMKRMLKGGVMSRIGTNINVNIEALGRSRVAALLERIYSQPPSLDSDDDMVGWGFGGASSTEGESEGDDVSHGDDGHTGNDDNTNDDGSRRSRCANQSRKRRAGRRAERRALRGSQLLARLQSRDQPQMDNRLLSHSKMIGSVIYLKPSAPHPYGRYVSGGRDGTVRVRDAFTLSTITTIYVAYESSRLAFASEAAAMMNGGSRTVALSGLSEEGSQRRRVKEASELNGGDGGRLNSSMSHYGGKRGGGRDALGGGDSKYPGASSMRRKENPCVWVTAMTVLERSERIVVCTSDRIVTFIDAHTYAITSRIRDTGMYIVYIR